MARAVGLALDLPAELDYDEWSKVGARLVQAHNATPWMLGDWLLYGQYTYGRRYADAAERVGLEPQTLRVFAMVAGHFHPERRRPALSFEHHRVVVPLGLADRERLLDAAEAGRWSRDELRRAVAEARAALRDPRDDATIAEPARPGLETGPAEARVEIRSTPEARNRWAAAADAAGVTLDAWIAAVLDTAAERALAGAAA